MLSIWTGPDVTWSTTEENIDTTIVNGKIVYHKGTFAGGLSETELIREIDAEMVKGL
jgi:5-methylthioadenosine/S-adenosylhomocysteine deaminase